MVTRASPVRLRRWAGLTAVALTMLAATGCVEADRDTNAQFCEAWGVITTGETVSNGDTVFLVGGPISNRDPCRGDDLWHFARDDLEGVDGVLFESCDISWVDGGRSTAAAEGLDC